MIKIIKQLVNKESKYFFALSMGVDSLGAFLWMRNRGYKLIPVHFNHKLRPQNDLMEAKFNKMCTDLEIKYFDYRSSDKFRILTSILGKYLDYSPPTTSKTEAASRDLRLKFYENIVSDVTAPKEIITAHHLNDYVESYLLNCFRGHPNHTPIEFFSEFNIEDKQYFDGKYYKIIHPFLLSTKRDFRQYLERNNYMKYVVEDETNVENKGSRRNWLRNTIIPEMKKNKISLENFAKNKITSRLQLESFVVNS
jgi:tRNA(Ile)-lysidine synthase TilS/MesJ